MSGDVRSLEEVIAAALESFDYIDVSDAHADAEEYEQITERVAAAVREWCLAEPQIERAATPIYRHAWECMYEELPPTTDTAEDDDRDCARAVLHAVMGDTP